MHRAMKNSLVIILLLTFGSINFSTHAQIVARFTLDECAKEFYRESNTDLVKKASELRDCIIGKKFPAFKATALTGKEYSNADFDNKVVFITSWFTTCAPCIAEIPMFKELNEIYRDKGFVFLSFTPNNAEQITKFIKERPIPYDVITDAEGLIQFEMQWNYGYPTNIIINKKGEIVEFKNGSPVDKEGLEKAKAEFIAIIERELSR
jgi:thiol-disulfide isomerase/thioredoxin